MTNDEYVASQQILVSWAQTSIQTLSLLDLDAFRGRIEHAETLAPILDPTLYMRGMDKLRDVRRLADVAAEAKRSLLALAVADLARTEGTQPQE